jgi:ubiquinone/menaquinone biosynthesis C-methylase UbiE
MEQVKKIYENHNEFDRLLRHKIEFYINQRFIREKLPEKQLQILDLGGGVGRYSLMLSELGHKVTLIDLSEKNIKEAKELSIDKKCKLHHAEVGNALDLSKYDDDSFDVVLAMGPFYHIKDADERKKAILGIKRILRQNGLLFTAHLSKYAFFKYVMSAFPERIEHYYENFLNVFEHGVKKYSDSDIFTDNTYCMNAEDIIEFLSSYNFTDCKIIASEGLADMIEEKINELPDELFNKVAELNYRICSDQHILNSASHLLAYSRNEKSL